MHLDLSELSQLAPIFRELFKGYHVSRRDPELYAQLSNFQDQYRTLFKALGFELVCDTRGFYYFVPEQMGAQVNKTAQRLALFTFIIVEHLADQEKQDDGRRLLRRADDDGADGGDGHQHFDRERRAKARCGKGPSGDRKESDKERGDEREAFDLRK